MSVAPVPTLTGAFTTPHHEPSRSDIRTTVPASPNTGRQQSTLQSLSPPPTTRILVTAPARYGVILFQGEGRYDGQMQDDQPHGKGKMTYPHGLQFKEYTGMFDKGVLHGEGVLQLANGQKFTGSFEYGQMINGVLKDSDGALFKGVFRDQQLWEGTYERQGKVSTYKEGKEQTTGECCTIL